MLDYSELDTNVEKIKAQLDRFIGFDGKTAFAANNKEWLAGLNYIDFLRDIGSCFSVNKMLSYEAYKIRMETGLSFIEFNYQLLQSYDFLMLHKNYHCNLQIGGDDQWGNIVAGVDLVRRKTGDEVFGRNLLPYSTFSNIGATLPMPTYVNSCCSLLFYRLRQSTLYAQATSTRRKSGSHGKLPKKYMEKRQLILPRQAQKLHSEAEAIKQPCRR